MTSWIEVELTVGRDEAEAASDALQAMGAQSITFTDEEGAPLADAVLEPGPGETPLWPTISLRALFPDSIDRDAIQTAVLGLNIAAGPLNWIRIEDRDWERAWMERFEPMKFGRRLWIVPTGMAVPDEVADGASDGAVIRLDPGLAFGSGTHPTTHLCLEWIDARPMTGVAFVDYGCGSGVLGIAAALLGAESVKCVDHDSQALEATTANAVRNRVDDRLTCLDPPEFDDLLSTGFAADALVANILAGPLVELAPRLARAVRPGGSLSLSGLLPDQRDAVEAAYRRGFGDMNAVGRDGWIRLDGVRNGAGIQ